MKFIKCDHLKQKPDFSDLPFGKYMTDYMLEMDWTRENGWGEITIKPYENFSLSPAAMILHYGQGIFEGAKAFKNDKGEISMFRIESNLDRMNKSAWRMGMPTFDLNAVKEGIAKLVAIEKDWIPVGDGKALYLRPTMIATEPKIGVTSCGSFKFYVVCCPVSSYFKAGAGLVKIMIEDTFVRACAGGTGEAKCVGNYGASFLAMEIAKKKGYNQVLWLDVNHQYVEEVGTMNVMFVIDGEVVTPALSGSILRGITRDSSIMLLRELGYKVREEKIDIHELMKKVAEGRVTEMFGVGTAAIVSPVGTLGYEGKDYIIGENKPGPVGQALYRAMMDIQQGRTPDKFGWVTHVKQD